MGEEQVAFYAGLLIIVVGLIVWVVRPNNAAGKSEIQFLGFKFSFDVPAFAVMIIGIVLMVLSPRFHIAPPPPHPPPAPVKKIVCTGEYENNCPGTHDIFYTCGYFGSDEEIAKKICADVEAGHVRLKTVGGNHCGYALIEVTCRAPN
jgi:hypothetical protein